MIIKLLRTILFLSVVALNISNGKEILGITISNPANTSVCSAGTATFTATASAGTAPYTYQWYENKGSGFVAITNGTGSSGQVYSNATTATLTITNVTSPMNGYTYECTATNFGGVGSATSTAATLTAYAVLVNGTVSANQTICYGATPAALANVTAPTGGNGAYTYQWQSSPNNSTWTNLGGNSNALTAATMGALTSTTYYRRAETSGAGCGTVYSNTITITVDAVLAAGTIGGAQTICNNTTPTTLTNVASPTGGTGTYTYQWQSAAAIGGPYANATGVSTNATYSPAALVATTYYRRQETSGACGTVNSNICLLYTSPSPRD